LSTDAFNLAFSNDNKGLEVLNLDFQIFTAVFTKQHWFKSYYDQEVPDVFTVPWKGPDDY
jgi:hypothetical protein